MVVVVGGGDVNTDDFAFVFLNVAIFIIMYC